MAYERGGLFMEINEIKNLYVKVDEIKDLEKAKSLISLLEEEKENHASTLEELIEDMDDSQKMHLYDDYALANGHERCYSMSDLDELVGAGTPTEILQKFDLQKFNLNHDYFWTDRHGDYVSGYDCDFLYEYFYASDIANWLESENYDVPIMSDDSLEEWIEKMEEIQVRINELEERVEELEESK